MDSLPSTGRMTGAQREELIEQVKQQIAIATAQELLTVSLSLFISLNVCYLAKCNMVSFILENF